MSCTKKIALAMRPDKRKLAVYLSSVGFFVLCDNEFVYGKLQQKNLNFPPKRNLRIIKYFFNKRRQIAQQKLRIMKLITLDQFLSEILEYTHESRSYQRGLLLLQEYQDFLKQPLKLSMFVPCNDLGEVLRGKPLSPAKDSEWIRWENEEEEYFKAKEKLLFKGFEIQTSKNWIDFYGGIRVYNNCDSVHDMWSIVFENGKPRDKTIKTIEDISKYKNLLIRDKDSPLSF